MDNIIGLLMLGLLGTLLWAVICLLRKGKRKRSLIWFGVSGALFIATAQLIGLSEDWKAQEAGYTNHAEQVTVELREKEEAEKHRRITQDKQAREAGYKDYEDQKRAEREAQAKAAEEARLKALAGFPDHQTQSAAKAAGIARYEAYRLINNNKAITRYCAYKTQAVIFEQDKHSRMDRQTTEAAKNKVWEEYEALQQKLINKLNTDLDLVDFEFLHVSLAGHWDTYCRANEDNWSVLTQTQAKAVTRSDAKEAQRALNAFYLYNLNNQTTPFFDQRKFSAVDCTWDNYTDMRFVACKLHSLSYKSKWQMFLVGRIDGGRLAVYPINGDTSGKMNNTQARFHDENFYKRIFIKAYEEPHAYLARYAGPRIDINAVRKLFE